jgi:hypothetical protein
MGQISQAQVALSLRRRLCFGAAGSISLQLQEVGWECPTSASTRFAGSRLEHENSTTNGAPVVGECELLLCLRRHVDLLVMVEAAVLGRKLNDVLATLLVTLRLQILDVFF